MEEMTLETKKFPEIIIPLFPHSKGLADGQWKVDGDWFCTA